jgi:hypothetical protein
VLPRDESFRAFHVAIGDRTHDLNRVVRITMLMRRAEQPDQPLTWPGWEDSIQYALAEWKARGG